MSYSLHILNFFTSYLTFATSNIQKKNIFTLIFVLLNSGRKDRWFSSYNNVYTGCSSLYFFFDGVVSKKKKNNKKKIHIKVAQCTFSLSWIEMVSFVNAKKKSFFFAYAIIFSFTFWFCFLFIFLTLNKILLNLILICLYIKKNTKSQKLLCIKYLTALHIVSYK